MCAHNIEPIAENVSDLIENQHKIDCPPYFLHTVHLSSIVILFMLC